MAYSPYYATWHDADSVTGGGDTSTPLVAAALQHIENGIAAAAATADAAIPAPASPSTNDGLFWNGTGWVADTITNAKIDAAAAIDYSKLNLAGSIVNADIATGAAIALSKLAGAYTTYTPTWTSTGTAPAIGNATVSAWFIQIGKIIHAYGKIVFGSGSTYGTGDYRFALPATAAGRFTNARVGLTYSFDSSTGESHIGYIYLQSNTVMGVTYPATWPAGAETGIGQTTPWTWAQDDQILWTITYEAA